MDYVLRIIALFAMGDKQEESPTWAPGLGRIDVWPTGLRSASAWQYESIGNGDLTKTGSIEPTRRRK
jgi:hypothetical protein